MSAKVKLQNQEFDIPDDLIALDPAIAAEKGEEEAKKQRDNRLKRWLSTVSPAATNATLAWSEEEDKTKTDGSKVTVIRVTPQLGTKGGGVTETLMANLSAIPQSVHSVIALTVELKMLQLDGRLTGLQALPLLLSYQQRIADALEHEGTDERIIGEVARRMRDARTIPSPWVPVGF